MKGKPWYVWVSKFLLLAVALLEFALKELGVNIPWGLVITTGLAWGAQMLMALGPEKAWQMWVGKVLLYAVSIVELLIQQGLKFPLWVALAPLIVGAAQLLISMVPPPEPEPTA